MTFSTWQLGHGSTRDHPRGVHKFDRASVWITLYLSLNLGLTLYNKAIMSLFNFPFPWTLTAVHTLCSAIGSLAFYKLGFFTLTSINTLDRRDRIIILLFSLLYTINIAVSNISLHLVTVPFHQVVRAMTPMFTVLISVLFLKRSYSLMTYIALLPVMIGVAFATFGDYDYTAIGFILTVLGTFLASAKTEATHILLTGRNALEILLLMSPLAFLQTLAYSRVTGEMSKLLALYEAGELTYGLGLALLVNGTIAFLLNYVSFTANQRTSALTMTVAGNVKQVLSIILAVIIFNLSISITHMCGILLTLIGGALYEQVSRKEKMNDKKHIEDKAQPSELVDVKIHQ